MLENHKGQWYRLSSLLQFPNSSLKSIHKSPGVMIPLPNSNQILNSIITFNSIEVVDNPILWQFPSMMLFPNKNVFPNIALLRCPMVARLKNVNVTLPICYFTWVVSPVKFPFSRSGQVGIASPTKARDRSFNLTTIRASAISIYPPLPFSYPLEACRIIFLRTFWTQLLLWWNGYKILMASWTLPSSHASIPFPYPYYYAKLSILSRGLTTGGTSQ